MAAVIIIAHAPLASALKQIASHVYADSAHDVLALDVAPDALPEQVRDEALGLMQGGSEAEWLVLTDVFGATPCNAALMLVDPLHVRVVTGVNVPMLWRTLCYADESLEALVARAIDGATRGVMQLSATRPQNQSQNLQPARDPVHRHHQQ